MANKKIKGITISFDGETRGLDKALQGVNKKSRDLQKELRDVQRGLKFNPNSVELLAQKQQLLTEQVSNTTDKLSQLKEAQSQVERQFQRGEIGAEQYRAFRREIEQTESQLNHYSDQLKDMQQEQNRMGDSAKQLENLFKATGKSVDDFSDALGSKLTNSIKNGTASSKQLDEAIEKIGRASLGANADLEKMQNALKSLDSGSSLDQVRKELGKIADAANDAEKEVGSLSDELSGLAGGLVAGGGIAGAIDQALDASTTNTKIDITFDVPEESKKTVKDSINQIQAYGVDAEAALEGVRRQWALNADASDEVNKKVVESAGAISSAFDGVDFTELIQETNEISKSLNISNEEALGLTNALLKTGFPPEQLDIISEYGTQLQMAGYQAEEIQALFAAGVDTGTWNIDNLLDGLKEGRIKVAEFGQEIPKALKETLEMTNISAKQMQEWGKSVAEGGEEGSKAMTEIAGALNGINDETIKNALGVQVFGTIYEDQGQNIIDTLLNAKNATADLKENQGKLNDTVSKLDADPAVKMQKAISDLKVALQPLLTVIANVVGAFASWMSENPKLAATITAIVSVIGILVGIVMAIAPLITTIAATTLPAFGAAFAAVAAPIGIAIAAITAIIAIVALIVSNWEPIKEFFSTLWDGVKNVFVSTVESISGFLSGAWEGIKNVAETIWNGIKDFFAKYWDELLMVFTGPIGILVGLVTKNWDRIKEITSKVWENIKTISLNLWESIKTTVMAPVNAIKEGVITAFENMKNRISNIWSGLKNVIKAPLNSIINLINSFISGLNKLKIPEWVPGVGGQGINIPKIPALAKGTNFFKGGYALVGEEGPELVEMPTGAKVHTNSKTQGMLDNPINITIERMEVRDDSDIQKIARELYNLQRSRNRGAGYA